VCWVIKKEAKVECGRGRFQYISLCGKYAQIAEGEGSMDASGEWLNSKGKDWCWG